MALIKCEECNKQISDRATSCPNCGCPNEIPKSPKTPKKIEEPAPVKINGDEATIYYTPDAFEPKEHIIRSILRIFIHLIMAIFLFSGETEVIVIVWTFCIILLFIIRVIDRSRSSYKKQVKELPLLKKRIHSVRKYLESRYPILNETKPEYKIIEVLHQKSPTKEEAMFHIYLKAYEKKADAIVINSDQAITNVTGSIKSDVRGKHTSGNISSHTENDIMATLIKY